MIHEPTDPWTRALRVAESACDGVAWPERLAQAIEAAVRPDVAGVFLCPLGNMLRATSAMAPRTSASLGLRLVEDILPRMHRAGLDTPWEIFRADSDSGQHSVMKPLHTELLAPAGFRGLVGEFLRSSDGMVAGWLAVFTHEPGERRRLEIAAPLVRVCHTAEGVLRSAITIAARLGARFPKISPDLSERECEVARLAAKGFTDLNIAKSLAISEGTVGRHLHNIYRKLGVSSRIELGELLGAAD